MGIPSNMLLAADVLYRPLQMTHCNDEPKCGGVAGTAGERVCLTCVATVVVALCASCVWHRGLFLLTLQENLTGHRQPKYSALENQCPWTLALKCTHDESSRPRTYQSRTDLKKMEKKA